MDGPGPGTPIDARAARFERVAIAVVLLGGYVFGIIYVIPGLAVVLAVSLGFGSQANLFRQLFTMVIADRLKPATVTEPEGEVRFSELFAVVVLSIATLLVVVGLGGLAWVFALIEAGICAVHATTGLSVEGALRERLRGRRGTG